MSIMILGHIAQPYCVSLIALWPGDSLETEAYFGICGEFRLASGRITVHPND